MKYAYYPGCSLHSTAKDFDMSAKAVCETLGIELAEIPGWICCGATSAHSTSELLAAALPVKNLIASRQMGLDTVVNCAACYSRLRLANEFVTADEKQRARVNEVVGAEYNGDVAVRHLLDVLVSEYGLDTVKEKVRKPLADLKVAAYYGCLLSRPPKVVAFDNAEHPTSMDRLTVALGGQAVEWPYKTECCGQSLSLTRTDVVLKLCRDILQMASDEGAECLMVACPLCQSNLDLRQAQVNRQYGSHFALPVFYFTQLLGLALGLDRKVLGLDKLLVTGDALLKAKGLV